MSPEVVVAIIGFLGTIITLGVGVYSSIESYKQSETSKRNERSEHEALLYLKDQLVFYSSIHALLEANKEIFFHSPQINADLEHSNLNKEEQLIVDKILIPNNERIVNKIIDNPHLIEGSIFPECYSRFLAHATVWKAFNDFAKRNITFQYNSVNLQFPQPFAAEVEKQMKVIKKRYYDLVNEQKSKMYPINS